jgi:N-acetylneuraminic acid mutarotase
VGGGTNPTARGDSAGALDPTGTSLVVFGGDTDVAICPNFPTHKHVGDTWLLDVGCGSWAQLSVQGPDARARHVMISDPDRGRALLFGGRTRARTSGAYSLFDDVWAFDFGAQSWQKLATSGSPPPARSSAAIAVDAQTSRLVLFGGNASTDGLSYLPLADTWTLDLATNAWKKLTPPKSPPARLFHAMAIDPDGRIAYVWSGGDANAFVGPFLHDVWALDLDQGTWSAVATTGQAPTGRIRHSMVFDRTAHVLVTFAGHDDDAKIADERNDLYVLDVGKSPAEWSRLPPGDTINKTVASGCNFPADLTNIDKAAPERRSAFAVSEAAGGRGFVVFGGESDCGLLNDAWWWSNASSAWTPVKSTPVGLSCLRVSTTCTSLCN